MDFGFGTILLIAIGAVIIGTLVVNLVFLGRRFGRGGGREHEQVEPSEERRRTRNWIVVGLVIVIIVFGLWLVLQTP
ncbi:MAG: hypothetical protein Q4G40_06875 [Brachybacterium sp.]|nr:hypothetical protein [Brachybacterium sp.]